MAVAAPPAAAPPATEAPTAVATPRKRPRIYYGYYLVAIALICQFVSAGSQTYVSGVFLGPMTHDLGWTRSQFTSGQTAGRFVMALIGFVIGAQVDKGRVRGLMVIGATILGGALILTSHVTQYWQWMVLRGVVFTVGAALMGNLVVNVTLSKWWVEKRGRVVGISSMGVSLAGVILPPFMTKFVDTFGWRNGWYLLGVMAWLLIYPAAMLMKTTPEEHGLNPDNKSDEDMASSRGDRVRADFANSLNRSQALRTPALYLIVIAFGMSGVGLGTMLQQTIPFATDSGFSRSTAAFMLTLLATPAAFTKPLWGAYMDYVPEKVAAATSFVLAAFAMVVILIGAHTGITLVLAVGFFLVGSGIGGQIPIQETIWATYFGRRYLGKVRSVALPFSLLLGAGGPQLVSTYFDKVGNYDGAFIGLAVLWGTAAWLVLLIRRPAVAGQRPNSAPPGGAAGPSGDANGRGGGAPRVPTVAVPIPMGAWWGASAVAATPWVGSSNGSHGGHEGVAVEADSWGYARPSNGVQRATERVVERPTPVAVVPPAPAPSRSSADYGLGAGLSSEEAPASDTRDYMGRQNGHDGA